MNELHHAFIVVEAVTEEFAVKEIVPNIERIEHKEWAVTRELIKKASEIGIANVDVPEEFGGSDMDKVSSAIIADRIAKSGSFSVNPELGLYYCLAGETRVITWDGIRPIRELAGDPGAVGDVLAVHDADVCFELVAERRQAFLDGAPAGDAEDICEEEKSQFRTSVAAGRNSIETWLPASFV